MNEWNRKLNTDFKILIIMPNLGQMRKIVWFWSIFFKKKYDAIFVIFVNFKVYFSILYSACARLFMNGYNIVRWMNETEK